MPRVTVVMPSAHALGGAEESFRQLLTSAAGKAIEWQICYLEPGPLVDEIAGDNIESIVIHCGRTRELWKWWKAATQIGDYSKRFESQLILGWMTKGHVYGGLAAWQTRKGAAWFQMGLPERGILDVISRRLPAKCIFACSKFVADLQSDFQPSVNVRPVPLGVDLGRFEDVLAITPQQARAQLGLPVERPIIGTVGRLQRWKGMHILLESMPAVLKKVPNAYCIVVGGEFAAEPAYPNTLRDLTQKLSIEDSVLFAGAQSNVPLWMRAMDVFVHTSQCEPFGIVIVEALSLGLRVIATTPGGPDEIIQSGVNGLLCPFNDQATLSASLVKFLAEPDCVTPEAARRRGRELSADEFAKRLVEEIRSLV